MRYSNELGCHLYLQSPSVDGLQKLFQWYLSLEIPYETLSNIDQEIFIKNAEQMLVSVTSGGGGHCVEHSVLLSALLSERGFANRLINADYLDHQRGLRVAIAKPMVLVELDEDWWVCDPYYRRIVYPVPAAGVLNWGAFQIARLSPGEFSLSKRQGDKLLDEDLANCSWELGTRLNQFESRYQEFSPFGITAPFFQVLRPVRKSVFYSPRHDSLIVAEGDAYRSSSPEQLKTVEWIPDQFHSRIVAAIPKLRQQRSAALAFLDEGAFPPYYERLRDVGEMSV